MDVSLSHPSAIIIAILVGSSGNFASLLHSDRLRSLSRGLSQIESLYSEGVLLKLGLQDDLIKKLRLPDLVTRLHESSQGGGLLKYDTPKILSKDRFLGVRDETLLSQALCLVNPVSIEKLKVFPPVSQLDPEIYGPQESALKEEHILGYLKRHTYTTGNILQLSSIRRAFNS
ncbi:linoleate 13S-lipoxygenase 3-1, chloroplastic-like protein [Tanacetum coccineum]